MSPSAPGPSDPRFERIIEAIAEIGAGRYQVELPPVEQMDALDAVTMGLQMLCEELQSSFEHRLAAERLSEVRSRFLATMSHEIRTPLNGILGMLDQLEDTTLDDGQQAIATLMRRSSAHLLGIVNDVLEFSKAESGELHFAPAPTSLSQILEDTLGPFAARARERGVVVRHELPEALSRWYVVDGQRLGQVVINLVGNALKFTTEGEVVVAVRDVGVDGNTRTLRFEVRDTGPGIPQQQLRRIFDAFYQAEQSPSARRQGTGLGLAISMQIVRAMGGEIEAESVPGVGSTFFFTIRLVETQPPTMRPRSVLAPEALEDALQGLSVLVAEDNAVNQLVAKAAIRRLGVEPDLVSDGGAAVARVAEGAYDVVLMDCMMPGTDGYEATRRIRTLPLPRQPVICALSAAVTETERRACFAAGMDAHLTKPLDRTALARLLLRVATGELAPREALSPSGIPREAQIP